MACMGDGAHVLIRAGESLLFFYLMVKKLSCMWLMLLIALV